LLTRFGRAGNEKAAVGHAGYLYYVPGITHVAGPGFLEQDVIESRERGARLRGEPVPVADPRPAIFELDQMLKRRGIRLVVFPVPDKAMLEPQGLQRRASSEPNARVSPNRDFARFVAELRARGIRVFDATPERLAARDTRRFLLQDTHWTPRWMEQVAGQLAASVAPLLSPATPGFGWKRVARNVERVGDITDMLKLPENQQLFAKERVSVNSVVGADDAAWEPDPKAETLLLGDSFTNVFSLDYMGWGESAGLAPQLAFELARPVDVLAQNDSGANATRKALELELRAGEDRLAGKKVVIWQFAARELSVGDWKRIDWSFVRSGAAP
jgi:alginate O-acetyltransferase complex protein AlgJ